MKNKPFSILATIFFVFLCFCVSCKHSSDNDSYEVPADPNELSVAVFAPISSDKTTTERFQRTADWFLAELAAAKNISSASVSLKLNWYDENENLATTAASLVSDTRTRAIIGPIGAENVQTVAQACLESYKPLIVPSVSSESIVRSYSVSATGSVRKPFLWSLSECDIAQGEAILSKIKGYKGDSVAVLSSADQYGKTFFEWLPFQASQLGITVTQNIRYKTKNTSDTDSSQTGTEALSLTDALDELFNNNPGYIVCAVANTKDVETILSTYKAKGSDELLFFTGSAYSEALFSDDIPEYNYEGFALTSNPATGFDAAYRARFNSVPMLAEPQFYDSLLLVTLAAEYCIQHKMPFSNDNINNALKILTTGASQEVTAWDASGMAQIFSALDSGSILTGASGALKFASDTLTTVVSSVYLHWCIYNKKIIELDYTSTTPSKRISENVPIWNYIPDSYNFEETTEIFNYGEQQSRWALLVAGSKGWFNYRHQADVLNIYQFLKRKGFDDEHIILILADDIANNKSNPKKGMILSPDGSNLYTDVQIDYKLSELVASDIRDILLGVKNDRCNIVFDDAATDWSKADIFVFWSGHGSNIRGNPKNGRFEWAGKKDSTISEANFTTALMKETLEKMQSPKHYRNIVFFIETCYSASVMSAAEGFDGVLAFTAANGVETSFADIYNTQVNAWLTNRFTRTFIEKLSSTPDVSYRELYNEMLKRTLGSHVQVINASKFGSLYDNSPSALFD